MTEGNSFTPKLLDGDEDRLLTIDEDIKRFEKIRLALQSEGGQGVLAAVEGERVKWVDATSAPDPKVPREFAAGVVHGLGLVKDYAGSVEKNLTYLYHERSELLLLAKKEK